MVNICKGGRPNQSMQVYIIYNFSRYFQIPFQKGQYQFLFQWPIWRDAWFSRFTNRVCYYNVLTYANLTGEKSYFSTVFIHTTMSKGEWIFICLKAIYICFFVNYLFMLLQKSILSFFTFSPIKKKILYIVGVLTFNLWDAK